MSTWTYVSVTNYAYTWREKRSFFLHKKHVCFFIQKKFIFSFLAWLVSEERGQNNLTRTMTNYYTAKYMKSVFYLLHEGVLITT